MMVRTEVKLPHKTSLSTWLATAFAVPSALAFLSKLDERLNFGPILERVILNYNIVSKSVWGLFSNLIGTNLSDMHGILTVFTFYLIFIVRESLKIDLDIPQENKYLINIEKLSQSFFVGFAFSQFDFSHYKLIILMAVFNLLNIKLNKFHPDKRTHEISYVKYLVIFLILFLIGSHFFLEENSIKIIIAATFALVISASNKIIPLSKMYFSRVLVFGLGIFLIDWVAKSLIPNLETFLTTIGA